VSGTLADRGVVCFGHVGVADCGVHAAAAVNACLDTGADTVLAISVLHAFTAEMDNARQAVTAGGKPSDHETTKPGAFKAQGSTSEPSGKATTHFESFATSGKLKLDAEGSPTGDSSSATPSWPEPVQPSFRTTTKSRQSRPMP